jgi:exodeoxyribonuclease V beta subunit
VPDAQCGHRYIVVDYKTNRLHQRGAADPMAAYHPSLLPEAMAHSDYPLQSILYSVALHRYLRWRLPDYQPEQHLGGIAYLFVRGMVGVGTPLVDGAPHGVFSWRPPAATVVALDQLLAGGGL